VALSVAAHTHTHTHTHSVSVFSWFMGTFHRHNDFYTAQSVFSPLTPALLLNLPITQNFLHFYFFIKHHLIWFISRFLSCWGPKQGFWVLSSSSGHFLQIKWVYQEDTHTHRQGIYSKTKHSNQSGVKQLPPLVDVYTHMYIINITLELNIFKRTLTATLLWCCYVVL